MKLSERYRRLTAHKKPKLWAAKNLLADISWMLRGHRIDHEWTIPFYIMWDERIKKLKEILNG